MSGVSAGKVETQYFVGSVALFGHSTSSHSTGCGVAFFSSRLAGRTRRAAKREASGAFVPSRQVTRCQAFLGRLRASSLYASERHHLAYEMSFGKASDLKSMLKVGFDES